jgi:hypothetical protein
MMNTALLVVVAAARLGVGAGAEFWFAAGGDGGLSLSDEGGGGAGDGVASCDEVPACACGCGNCAAYHDDPSCAATCDADARAVVDGFCASVPDCTRDCGSCADLLAGSCGADCESDIADFFMEVCAWEETCEGHGFTEDECAAAAGERDCCAFHDGECWAECPADDAPYWEDVCEGHGFTEDACAAAGADGDEGHSCCAFEDGQCYASCGGDDHDHDCPEEPEECSADCADAWAACVGPVCEAGGDPWDPCGEDLFEAGNACDPCCMWTEAMLDAEAACYHDDCPEEPEDCSTDCAGAWAACVGPVCEAGGDPYESCWNDVFEAGDTCDPCCMWTEAMDNAEAACHHDDCPEEPEECSAGCADAWEECVGPACEAGEDPWDACGDDILEAGDACDPCCYWTEQMEMATEGCWGDESGGGGTNLEGDESGEGGAPTAAPSWAVDCYDDPDWVRKGSDDGCEWVEKKNEKVMKKDKYSEKKKSKKFKKNCKKKNDDNEKADDACGCSCDQDNYNESEPREAVDEGSVAIIVPVVIAAVLLVALACYLVTKRSRKDKQHRRVSMPWFWGGLEDHDTRNPAAAQ